MENKLCNVHNAQFFVHNSVIMTEPDFSPAALPGQARAHPLATLKGDGL